MGEWAEFDKAESKTAVEDIGQTSGQASGQTDKQLEKYSTPVMNSNLRYDTYSNT